MTGVSAASRTPAIVADAPGKLFLTGEWAVLRGAPALVAAVDRRVTVSVTDVGAAGCTVASAVDGGVVALTDEPARQGDAGIVAAALRACGRTPDGLAVAVDARAFVADGRKLGLGRSAAALVAAVAALAPAAGHDDVLDRALVANAAFQGGQGSGADVAASVHGGVVEVRRRAGRLAVARRALPAPLRLVAGWTGTSAHTPPLLARFDGAPPPPVFAELVAAAEAAADACARADGDALLAAVERSGALLARFGHALGLPIVTPELERLVRAAARAGAAAKPSGAGGGDCGIALCRSEAEAAAVREAWYAAGIVPLALEVDARGVRLG